MTDDERNKMAPDEYADYLRFGTDDRESHIPGEFIHDHDGLIWFVSGGSQCVGEAFCQWHGGMDAVYVVGSSTIAGCGVDKETLQEAVDLLERINHFNTEYDRIDRDWLVELSKAALGASPSDDVQYVYQ